MHKSEQRATSIRLISALGWVSTNPHDSTRFRVILPTRRGGTVIISGFFFGRRSPQSEQVAWGSVSRMTDFRTDVAKFVARVDFPTPPFLLTIDITYIAALHCNFRERKTITYWCQAREGWCHQNRSQRLSWIQKQPDFFQRLLKTNCWKVKHSLR